MKYRQVTYLTFCGFRKIIELPDSAYGEWIIYHNNTPKFYISCFSQNESDIVIKNLLDKSSETIESIIKRINHNLGIKLSFGNNPLIHIEVQTEIIELDLIPLPIDWIIEL
ncbi:hypothetical protein C3K47_05445 [Solitalea longa]|uniref:Uncharacterized protein n=1 Tax=Solitalea longa TaxID=2079460 RepID=A0A2S5A6N1_9SPHI|nr:hypothetical protein C3K47_05445 [Solitalea longa]